MVKQGRGERGGLGRPPRRLVAASRQEAGVVVWLGWGLFWRENQQPGLAVWGRGAAGVTCSFRLREVTCPEERNQVAEDAC